ncbi:SufD family Fe-S cluster assembly protein [Candidatus Micrarchaeota archaeon]|nr:SufD family Fe-S cluster assembly protein [Candidatus Micrarchaeota archaeon]
MDELFPNFNRDSVQRIWKSAGEPPWMLPLRLSAFDRFIELELPRWKIAGEGKLEARYLPDWRYTDVSRLDFSRQSPSEFIPPKIVVAQEDEGKVAALPLSQAAAEYPRLVKEHFLSLFDWAGVKFSALHAAFFNSPAFVMVEDGAQLSSPVKISFSNSGSSHISSHALVILGENSSAAVIEERSARNSLCTHACEMILADGSSLDYSALQLHDENSLDFFAVRSRHCPNASLAHFSAILGSKFCKASIAPQLAGEGASASVRSFFFTNGNQHLDLSTNAVHSSSRTCSDTMVKGVLDGSSTSVYKGAISIAANSIQCVSDLNEHVLLLSEEAHSDAIPSLDINNNDVTAGHGASVGSVDPEQLFYLMSRGLSKSQAQAAIVEGFFEPLICGLPSEEVRARARLAIAQKLSGTKR